MSIGAIGGGQDIKAMVNKIVAAERDPKAERIEKKQADIQTDISAYGKLKESMSGVEDLMTSLDRDHVFSARTIAADDELFDASVTYQAMPASYNVEVKQLAAGHKLVSRPLPEDAKFSGGDVSLRLGGEVMNISLTSPRDQLIDLVRAINSEEKNPGIRATVVQDDLGSRLVLASDKTGKDNRLDINVKAPPDSPLQALGFNPAQSLNPMTEMQAPQDAELLIDGLSHVSSPTNTIDTAIEGVTLTVKKLSDPNQPPPEITVGYNRDAVHQSLEAFVNAYNQFYDVSQQLGGVNKATGEAGPLSGESVTRSAINQLRAIFGTPIDSAEPSMKTLSQVGITTNLQGRLEIDQDQLNKQLDNNFPAFEAFFEGRDGFARKVSDQLSMYTKFTGAISSREKSLNEQMRSLNGDMTQLDERMEQVRKRTFDQFSAMQSATGQMQAQLDYMRNMLGG
ncbi:B-type flagellar hook-associated protein 2 [Vibrio stylophorae]|uniref:Flagellar hook-associated protein 2 n=1 Tax=Vibrio stylophorae TaxID=659351 RepID=A0ABM8ZUX0_9VIBR|nr:flagellar filament capping protein FliD [Vibrio stylophorae]CAH0534120.1 B-type flagellar hook-associated protein 2 [Vibrio stylophorae]